VIVSGRHRPRPGNGSPTPDVVPRSSVRQAYAGGSYLRERGRGNRRSEARASRDRQAGVRPASVLLRLWRPCVQGDAVCGARRAEAGVSAWAYP